MNKFKICFICLCVLTISVVGFNLWVHAKEPTIPEVIEDKEIWDDLGPRGLWYGVRLLDAEPGKWWNLTERDEYIDEYILLAMENPGKFIYVGNPSEAKFWLERYRVPFVYNGTYYGYGVYFTDDFYVPDETASTTSAISALVLAPVWAVFGLTTIHMKRQQKHTRC